MTLEFLINETESLSLVEKKEWRDEKDKEKLKKLENILLEEYKEIQEEYLEHKRQVMSLRIRFWKKIFNIKTK